MYEAPGSDSNCVMSTNISGCVLQPGPVLSYLAGLVQDTSGHFCLKGILKGLRNALEGRELRGEWASSDSEETQKNLH